MKTSLSDSLLKISEKVIFVVGVLVSLFHLYAAASGKVMILNQCAIHLGGALIIGTLTTTLKRSKDGKKIPIWMWILNLLFIVSAAVTTLYLCTLGNSIGIRVATATKMELVFSAALLITLLLITRRSMGNVMPIIAVIAILYARFGNLLPGDLHIKGYAWKRILANLYMGSDGIFGTPLTTSATIVVIFIIFGSFLQHSGAGQAFIDTAFAVFGRVRGGPAKVAVVSSALFGSINGSSIANVVTTGTLTIPLMKKVGYESHFAGAVEAVASTGGQITPPVMGAAAFLVAENIGMPYGELILAAVFPALLYYYVVFLVVDMKAVKLHLHGLSSDEVPKLKSTLKESGILLLPIVFLIIELVVVKRTPGKAALYAAGLCLVCSWFGKKKMKVKEILVALADAGRDIVTIAAATGTAGIVIGMLGLTGVGLKFSNLLISLSGGRMWLLLILVSIAGIIMGMGLPTTGVYVILATIVAPALTKMGTLPLSAHMFVLFWGCISAITPPVALASYAGASIAGANMNKTGWEAVRIGMAGFILPFLFVYQPAILLQGTVFEVVWTIAVAMAGLSCLAAAINGLPSGKILIRVLFAVAAIGLITTSLVTDIIGIVLAAIALVLCLLEKKRAAASS